MGTCFGISSVVPECVPPSLSVRQRSPHTPSSASHNRPVFRWQTKSADLNPPDERSFLWWQQNSKWFQLSVQYVHNTKQYQSFGISHASVNLDFKQDSWAKHLNLFHVLKSLSLIFMMFYNFYCITQSYNEDFLFSTLCNFCYIVPEYITIQLRGFLYDDDKLLSYQPQDLVGRQHGRTDFRQSGGAWWTSH